VKQWWCNVSASATITTVAANDGMTAKCSVALLVLQTE